MTAVDTATITKSVARYNGLDYFSIVVPNWGGPGVREITLDKTASLAGLSIHPQSTVHKVSALPSWGNLIGNVAAFTGFDNYITEQVVPVTVEEPFEAQLPGPVKITAEIDSFWGVQNDTLTNPYPLILMNEDSDVEETFNIGTGTALNNNKQAPTLILNCWLRPGAANVATKRLPFFFQRSNSNTAAAFSPFIFSPIGGRKRVQVDVWAPTTSGGSGSSEFAVDIYRSSNRTSRVFGERIYPPVPGRRARLQQGPSAAGEAFRNHARLVIEEPNALFLAVRSRGLGPGPSLLDCHVLAED